MQQFLTMLTRPWHVCLALVGALNVTTPTSATIINLNSLEHGQIVTNQFAAQGMTVSANNPNRSFDLAIIFDTSRTNTADPDLEGPNWDDGNLPLNTVFNDVLILAENNIDVAVPIGRIDDPDDEGQRPAGDLIFDFAQPITAFGFDVIDVEGVLDENGRITFLRNGVQQGVVNFAQFVTPGPFFDATIEFGNHTANRIRPITAAQLNSTGFNRVIVTMGGSGALDNLLIPEPASLGFVACLAGLGLVRRRRN